MSKKKKIIVTIVTLVVIAGLITGGIFFYLWRQQNTLVAEVQPVENLNWGYGGNQMTSYGMVRNDFYQDVYLINGQTVKEVYVTEGQEVKAGDPLMAYDMTLTNLQIEMQELEVETIKNRITLAERELEKLKKEKPIPEQPDIQEPDIQVPDIQQPDIQEPGIQEPAQTDPATGAYHFLSGDISTEQVCVSGTGTSEDPYVIHCMPDCYVEGSYLNQLAAAEASIVVRLQIIDPAIGQAVPGQFWDISSQLLGEIGMLFDDMAKWSVVSRGPMEESDPIEPEIPIEPEPMEPDPIEPEIPQGYTAKELAEAIEKTKKDLKDLDLKERQAQLQLEQMQKVTEDGVVLASVDGVIKTVGDKDNPPQDGSAFITVSGSEGLYVTGTLSEMQLKDVQVGQVVYANAWETGMYFEATIQEISPYPTDNSNSWGEGNPNVSYYPYTAFIANAEGLKNGEYVDLTMNAAPSVEDNMAIFLQKAYVREEDGKSYVMIADENDRLKKQYVVTGRTLYGEAIEIKAGLSREDRIAFPYGKTAKEGVKVKDSSDGGMMYY